MSGLIISDGTWLSGLVVDEITWMSRLQLMINMHDGVAEKEDCGSCLLLQACMLLFARVKG
jgi:hypothetical protein